MRAQEASGGWSGFEQKSQLLARLLDRVAEVSQGRQQLVEGGQVGMGGRLGVELIQLPLGAG